MDWRKGDWALCVDDGPMKYFNGIKEVDRPAYITNLRRGLVFAVTHVVVGLSGNIGICNQARAVGGISTRFVKITPDTEDAFDREVIEALKSEPVHVLQHDALHNSCQCEVLTCADAEQVRP